MGATSCTCCSILQPQEAGGLFESPKKNENLISIDYFFNYIPEEILNEMNKEKKFISQNKYELRTERIMIDKNSSSELDDNIKEMLYHGEFNELGQKDGVGKMIIIKETEKIFYHGNWREDNLIKGTIYYEDGSKYSGEIKNNKRNGKGDFTIQKEKEKEKYSGEWKNDQADGEGTLIFSDGTTYKGHFKENKFNGEGEMTWNNGISYKGTFLNNCFHGKGILKGNNGHIYDGDFQNGKFHGKGIFTWKNRNEIELYEGNYSCGLKDGKGKLKFNNGHSYDGLWKSGEPDGEGIYESNYRKYFGNWRAGIFMQLIDVEEKGKTQEEGLNLTFNVPIEDIYITDHVSISINTTTSIKSSCINPFVTYIQ